MARSIWFGRNMKVKSEVTSVKWGLENKGCQRTSVVNNAYCTCKFLWASKEMWGVWLLLLWVPALLMSLSGPVSKTRPVCVPSRPQTAVISPVMARHGARLAWHTGEISNIHLLRLLQAVILQGIHLAAILASSLTSFKRKKKSPGWDGVSVQ